MSKNEILKHSEAKLALLRLITDGAPNMPLPNRNELSQQLGVSRVTLERAIAELIGEGYLKSKVGSGTYIMRTSAKKDEANSDEAENIPAHQLDESTWALVISSVTHFSYPQLIRGCEDFTHECGINLVICNSDNKLDKQDEYVNKLAKSGVSGIIMLPCSATYTNWRPYERLDQLGISIVDCNRQIPGFDHPCVLMNFYQSGFMATDHLYNQGARHIAFIAPPHYVTVTQRYQGYLTALDMHGIDYAETFYTRERQYELSEKTECDIAKFIEARPELDGVFAFNDSLAMRIYGAMKLLGKQPGSDIKICSCDNTELAEALHVPLTSIDFPNYEMGRIAAEFLKRLRAGEKPSELPRMILAPHLVTRQSTLIPYSAEAQKV